LKAYYPSNEAPIGGIFLLVLVAVLGGLILGGILYAVSNLIYLVLLFPLGLGFVGGMIISWAVTRGKVRNIIIASVFGALMGLVIYGVYTYGEYYFFQQDVYKAISENLAEDGKEIGNVSPTEVTDMVLDSEVGETGFPGFMKYMAKEGVTITGRSSSGGFTLSGIWYWVYFIIELVLIITVAVIASAQAAGSPFCERCDEWYGSEKLVGLVDVKDAETLIQALNRDDYMEAGSKLLQESNYPRLEVSAERCPVRDDCDIYLHVQRVSLGRKNEEKKEDVAKGLITVDQYATLTSSIANAEAAAAESSEA
jgi:hypothetical protein